jgi:DNA-binding GntR family transcriptional regulator
MNCYGIRRSKKMGKLKRKSAREQIRDYILKGIYEGTYPPGSRLREKELAEFFGTSQAPVREALRELEGLQYVVTYPYKGTIVKKVTSSDIAVAYRLRGFLEQMAAEAACKLDNKDWTELKNIANDIKDAAENGDKEKFAEYDVKFHKYIVMASGVSMIEHMWKLVSFPIRVEKTLELVDISMIQFSNQHQKVIEAFENGDC